MAIRKPISYGFSSSLIRHKNFDPRKQLLHACARLRLEMAGRDTAGRYSPIAITSACVDEDRNPVGMYRQGLCK
ncbi:hypothetical protein F2Q70_00021699 [Brassica cretica]|uniref:Uncharacterized protein n=1 Tax=Brassica cretica TaxID=69181 RepID=A0A8S9GVF9_BRACR|nr:hypothetical protein F2Q70_00021699 [Brassica cretica]KAF3605147.1 hypothetical protein DY000_02048025 [Brassica cretica]